MIYKRLEGVHVIFIGQVTGETVWWQWDGMWKRKGIASVLRETGTQTLGEYFGRWQTTVTEWVALGTI